MKIPPPRNEEPVAPLPSHVCVCFSLQSKALFAAWMITFFRCAWPTSPINDGTSLCFGFNEVYLSFYVIGPSHKPLHHLWCPKLVTGLVLIKMQTVAFQNRDLVKTSRPWHNKKFRDRDLKFETATSKFVDFAEFFQKYVVTTSRLIFSNFWHFRPVLSVCYLQAGLKKWANREGAYREMAHACGRLISCKSTKIK